MFKIEILDSAQNEYNEQYGKFSINALEPGQGITIGSSLRRALLTDLTGLAIVGIRIANINTEFSNLPGVREDILEIVLNVKEIVVEGEIEPTKRILGRLKMDGPGVITAGLIEFESNANVNIINPNQYIATISAASSIEMEFLIESGTNYRLVDSVSSNNYPADFLKIDAVFMPVRKVAYEITSSETNALENNASLQSKENLTVEIWTNGSISPIKALVFASSILSNLANKLLLEGLKFKDRGQPDWNILEFKTLENELGWKTPNPPKKLVQIDKILPMQNISEEIDQELLVNAQQLSDIDFNKALTEIDEGTEVLSLEINNQETVENKYSGVKIKERDISQIKIEELVLSARAYNGLKRVQIHSVGDLMQYSVKDLKEIKNFGKKSLEEVVASLKNLLDINLL